MKDMSRSSAQKKMRVTKTGKVMRLRMGIAHKLAKKSGKVIRNKKSNVVMEDWTSKKFVRKYLF